MNSTHGNAIRAAVLGAPGPTGPALREAVMRRGSEVAGLQTPSAGAAIPADLAPWVDKILLNAYKVLDRDVAALREAGHTDDALFDVVVSAAAGAGLARLARGLELMD